MSVIIGIDFRQDSYELAIYNRESDNVEIRKGGSSHFKEIISNLKDEFGDRLEQIFVLPDKELLAGNNIKEQLTVFVLSEEDLDFTHYLSTKLASKAKLLEFNCEWDSAVKCILYDITTSNSKNFETKPAICLKTRFDVDDFEEMLIQVFDLKFNETHVIVYKSDAENNIFAEKVIQKNELFCSFTMMDLKELKNVDKIIIFGRFLFNDKDVQSLIKLESNVEQYFGRQRLNKSNFEVKNPESYTVPRPIKNYESQTNLMGIDLGSSRCVVCISRSRESRLVRIDKFDGEKTEYPMKTFISFDEKEPIIGDVALRKLKDKPRSVLFDFKQILKQGPLQEGWMKNFDDSWTFGICETSENKSFVVHSEGKLKQYSATEIYTILLKELKKGVSEFQSELNKKDVNQAVITVPRLFNYDMIINIRKAADLVGIKIIDIIDETHADLLYYLSEHDMLPGESVVIIDIGGGTGFTQKFMVRSHNGKKKITQVSYAPFDFYGRAIDKMLMRKLREFMLEQHNVNMDNAAEYKMLKEIEQVKEKLSFDETVNLELPSENVRIKIPLEIKRSWFETEVVEPLLLHERVKEVVTSMHESSKVFLVGGTCRIPYVQNYFKSIFGENKVVNPSKFGNLQEITAHGALIRGLQVLNKETVAVLCDKD